MTTLVRLEKPELYLKELRKIETMDDARRFAEKALDITAYVALDGEILGFILVLEFGNDYVVLDTYRNYISVNEEQYYMTLSEKHGAAILTNYLETMVRWNWKH